MQVKLLVLMACAALACGCSSTPMKVLEAGVPDVCQPTGTSLVIAEPEAYPGGTVTVHAAGRFVTCDGGPDVPVDVSARVFSPGGEPLPLTLAVHSARYQDDDGGLSRFFGFFDPDAGATLVRVDATFETAELGLYHLNLQFEPNLGAIQQEVLSMVDRRGAGPNTVPLPYFCDDFDVQQGIALCHENGVVHTFRDGVPVADVDADEFIADGTDLWALQVRPDLGLLLVDYRLGADGSLTRQAIGSTDSLFAISQFGNLPALAWSQGQVLLVSVPGVLLASVDGGTIELRDAGTLPQMPLPEVALTFLAGQGAIIGYLPQSGLGSQLCLLDFVHDTMDCRPGSWLADDTDTVWALSNSGSLTAWQVDAGPAFTSTDTDIVELPTVGLFQESGFPFTTAFSGRSQNLFGLFAVSFGPILRRPLPPPQSRVGGYGFWPPFQTSVSRGVIWSSNFDFLTNTTVVSYVAR